MGIFGLGPVLETLLTAEVRSRAFLDLKPVSYRNSFTHKFSELLLKISVKDAKICGHDWQMLSILSHKINAKPYYTIKNLQGLKKLKIMVNKLKKPAGLSIHHGLVTKDLINYCSRLKTENFSPRSKNNGINMTKFELWAWTVNDKKEAERLALLGVDGIITDEWGKLLKSGSGF